MRRHRPLHPLLRIFGCAGLAPLLALSPNTARAAESLKTVVLTGTQAPGEPSGSTFTEFVSPALNSSGDVVFGGDLSLTGNSPRGIWADINGAIVPIARETQQAPTFPAGDRFAAISLQAATGPFITDQNAVSFEGVVSIGGGNYSRSIWYGPPGGISPAIRSGSPAPGTINDVFADFQSSAMNKSGAIAVEANLQFDGIGDVNLSNDRGIWAGPNPSTLTLLAREGSAAPGVNDSRVFQASTASLDLSPFSDVRMNDQGKVSFAGRLSDDTRGLWVGDSTGVDLVALGGQQAPGTPPGAVFAKNGLGGIEISGFSLSSAGNIAFPATLKEGTGGVTPDTEFGLWARIAGALTLVARENSQAPGFADGVAYSYYGARPFGSISVDDAGEVVFSAHLAGPGMTDKNNSALFFGTTDHLHAIAEAGSTLNGMPPGFVLGDVLLARPTLNAHGQFAFFMDLAPINGGQTKQGLWFYDPSSGLHLLAYAGEQLEVSPGDFRTVARLVGSFDDPFNEQSDFNDSGDALFAAYFTDGSEGLFLFGVPELGPTLPLMALALVPILYGKIGSGRLLAARATALMATR